MLTEETKSNYGAAFATVGEESRNMHARSVGGQGKSQSGGKKQKQQAKAGNQQKTLNEKKAEPSGPKKGPRDLSKIKCWECNKIGHFSSDCLERVLDEDGEENIVGSVHCGKLAPALKDGESHKCHPWLLGDDLDMPDPTYSSDDDDMSDPTWSDSENEEEVSLPPPPPACRIKAPKVSGPLVHNAGSAFSGEGSLFAPYEVLLDAQADVTVLKLPFFK